MKLMLSSLENSSTESLSDLMHYCKYALMSFYYLEKNRKEITKQIYTTRNELDNFMLDSGAFTFMSNAKKITTKEMDDYVTRYIKFIKKHQIKRYVELDVDKIFGYQYVKDVRERLEKEIGYQCIPVWHKSRGIENFKETVEKYNYIAIGGFAIKDIRKTEYQKIKKLIQYANSKKCKVHGLGFTPNEAHEFGWYSVDSSSWRSGVRYGSVYKFENGKIKTIKKPKKSRMDPIAGHRNNFVEWCKMQKYVERKYSKFKTGVINEK